MSLFDFLNRKKKSDAVEAAMGTLREMGRDNCKKCFGRGFIGIHAKTGQLIPCMPCARKAKAKKERELLCQGTSTPSTK